MAQGDPAAAARQAEFLGAQHVQQLRIGALHTVTEDEAEGMGTMAQTLTGTLRSPGQDDDGMQMNPWLDGNGLMIYTPDPLKVRSA